MDIGAAKGLKIEENTFVRINGSAVNNTDICIYSSERFSCEDIAIANTCTDDGARIMISSSSDLQRHQCNCTGNSSNCGVQKPIRLR